ncbi:MAG TPA: MerR family transcriptional regulator [Chloroflexota bacterium]|nr:MerR family transcriptional regulator [Chloroflexota bacterium]
MTIGELAARFGLATHVLRHWEAVGLLTPAARVNGRRRYRREHLARVAMILRGKEAGFSLQELGAVLHAPDRETRRALLERHHAALEERMAQLQASKHLIEHALECPSKDFTTCPNFLRLTQLLADRVPLADDPRWPHDRWRRLHAHDALTPLGGGD